jgi:hypothetical protein
MEQRLAPLQPARRYKMTTIKLHLLFGVLEVDR